MESSARTSAPSTALAGIVVLDLTHTLAGPLCTQSLADAGATVVKIEQPGGEFSRIRGYKRTSNGVEVSSYHAAVNRGKRSIVIDLKSAGGVALFRDLVSNADVLVENFAPAAMDRLGLNLAGLRAEFPRLITVSISLFGGVDRAGPLSARGGFAIVAEAESSMTSGMRDESGAPMPFAMPLGDMASGLTAYGATVTALFERERTGRGGHVDISMVRSLMTLNAIAITGDQIVRSVNGVPRQYRTGGYGVFETKDGHVVIGVTTDRLFARLATVMGRHDMLTDPRYADFRERDARVDEVNAAVAGWTSLLSTDAVAELCEQAQIPVGKVRTVDELVASEDIARLGFLEDVGDGGGGAVRAPQNPFGFRQTVNRLPRLNEHRDEILCDLFGFTAADVERMAADGVFGEVS